MNSNVPKPTRTTVSLLIGYDFSEEDKGVLIVGRKAEGENIEVVNAFEGEEAWELYKKLITKKGE